MKNVPYKKQFDKDGLVTNPITKSYVSTEPNRKARREPLQKERFVGGGKNYHLSVVYKMRFKRVLQVVLGKRITHYLAC